MGLGTIGKVLVGGLSAYLPKIHLLHAVKYLLTAQYCADIRNRSIRKHMQIKVL